MYDAQAIENAQVALIEALSKATEERRLDWIRTDPEQVKWKEGTLEQLYAMLSEDGIFATFTRMRDNSMELVVQVQQTGFYREYELTCADGSRVQEALRQLYRSLPSVFRMVEDFHLIIAKLEERSAPISPIDKSL